MTTQMATEVAEQPNVLRSTLDALLPLRDEVGALLRERRRVMLVARGSSDNAALYGRYLLETHAGVPCAMAAPSVATHYDAHLDLSDTVVVSVSQSGETAEIVQTQAWAARCGAATVAVTNGADSALAREAGLALVTTAGRELAVPATKTYLAQVAAMALVGTAAGPADPALDDALLGAAGVVAGLLAARDGVDDAVELLARPRQQIVTGRGLLMGTALETALKLEETCLQPVRGYSYADLRHGPISVVDDDVTALVVAAPDGPLRTAMTELAGDLRGRGATVVGVGGDDAFRAACDLWLPGGDLTERLAPLASIVPLQLVVEQLARTLGLDPDAPRGLSKVTRTDAP
ncbi:SIS domain-containing protein [Solicola sp. PLA-1-18]|uniref:SIS domain-containing protein n=1 Tax=Solicola sp. PLA-1-18 TaxID=3380532 RepID=UPI003B7F20AA